MASQEISSIFAGLHERAILPEATGRCLLLQTLNLANDLVLSLSLPVSVGAFLTAKIPISDSRLCATPPTPVCVVLPPTPLSIGASHSGPCLVPSSLACIVLLLLLHSAAAAAAAAAA